MPLSGRIDVCLVSSRGGHLEELTALRPAYAAYRHAHIVPPGPQATALAAGGHAVHTIPDASRDPREIARNALIAARLVARLRPRVVLSLGAGAAVPTCIAARAAGACVVHVESVARVHRPSRSGSAIARVAHHVLVQWPQLRDGLPGSEVCRPVLADVVERAERRRGEGTFVAVGTHRQPFDRLLQAVDQALAAGRLPAPAVAQVGTSTLRSARFAAHGTLPPDRLDAAIAASDVFVCHAGAGLIGRGLAHGRVPLVLARRRALGEHVDDHQAELAAELSSVGLVASLDELPLDEALERARAAPVPSDRLQGPPLVDRIAELLSAAVGGDVDR